MRRAILALGGTIAGLTLLLSFKSHGTTPGATAATATPGNSSPSQPGGSADASGSAPASGSANPGGGAAGGGTAGGGQTGSGQTGSPGTRTVTGAVDTTQYGPMQIALTLSGQRITKVTVLQRTNTGAESNQIDSFAIPKLTSETLAAQSARIDAVSGATYTSAGYIKSLQSAVDKARA